MQHDGYWQTDAINVAVIAMCIVQQAATDADAIAAAVDPVGVDNVSSPSAVVSRH